MARHVNMRILSDEAGKSDIDWLTKYLRFNFYLNRLASGDRLPSVRELARTLHISPNTALELYKELENAGVVETRARSGTFLKGTGTEEDRTSRDLTLFALMGRVARSLEVPKISPADFAQLFLRYTGATQRGDFVFAFMASTERFQILERQLASRLTWHLPMIALSPDSSRVATARERIAKESSIRCLVSSYLYCDVAFRLAEEFRLPVILERLSSQTAEVFEPPAPGRCRYIVTRDTDFAANIRDLMRTAYGADAASRVKVAALQDAERLAQTQEAEEMFVSPFAWDAVTEMFGATKRIQVLPLETSQETVDDLLFHYVFTWKARPSTKKAAG